MGAFNTSIIVVVLSIKPLTVVFVTIENNVVNGKCIDSLMQALKEPLWHTYTDDDDLASIREMLSASPCLAASINTASFPMDAKRPVCSEDSDAQRLGSFLTRPPSHRGAS